MRPEAEWFRAAWVDSDSSDISSAISSTPPLDCRGSVGIVAGAILSYSAGVVGVFPNSNW